MYIPDITENSVPLSLKFALGRRANAMCFHLLSYIIDHFKGVAAASFITLCTYLKSIFLTRGAQHDVSLF